MPYWSNIILLKPNLESKLILFIYYQKQGFSGPPAKSSRPRYTETPPWPSQPCCVPGPWTLAPGPTPPPRFSSAPVPTPDLRLHSIADPTAMIASRCAPRTNSISEFAGGEGALLFGVHGYGGRGHGGLRCGAPQFPAAAFLQRHHPDLQRAPQHRAYLLPPLQAHEVSALGFHAS
jgi:hypothetical protein